MRSAKFKVRRWMENEQNKCEKSDGRGSAAADSEFYVSAIANGGFADAERRHFWNRLDGDRDGTKAA